MFEVFQHFSKLEGVSLLRVLAHCGRDARSALIETIHLEILLPAFTVGCIVKHPHSHTPAHSGAKAGAYRSDMAPPKQLRRMSTMKRIKNLKQENVSTCPRRPPLPSHSHSPSDPPPSDRPPPPTSR